MFILRPESERLGKATDRPIPICHALQVQTTPDHAKTVQLIGKVESYRTPILGICADKASE